MESQPNRGVSNSSEMPNSPVTEKDLSTRAVEAFNQINNPARKSEFIKKAVESGNTDILLKLLEVVSNPVHISSMVDKITEAGNDDQLQKALHVLRGKAPIGARRDGQGAVRANINLQISKIQDRLTSKIFS